MKLTAEMRANLDALPADQVKEYALDLIERELTEERTDRLAALLADLLTRPLPWWGKKFGRPLIRKGLDYALPEQFIMALRKALG